MPSSHSFPWQLSGRHQTTGWGSSMRKTLSLNSQISQFNGGGTHINKEKIQVLQSNQAQEKFGTLTLVGTEAISSAHRMLLRHVPFSPSTLLLWENKGRYNSVHILQGSLMQPQNSYDTSAAPCHMGPPRRRKSQRCLEGPQGWGHHEFSGGNLQVTFRKWSLGGRVSICKLTPVTAYRRGMNLTTLHAENPNFRPAYSLPCRGSQQEEPSVNNDFRWLFNLNSLTHVYLVSFLSSSRVPLEHLKWRLRNWILHFISF